MPENTSDMAYASARRSGEIVFSDTPHGIPGTIALYNGGLSHDDNGRLFYSGDLSLERLRTLISQNAEHKDGRMFVPGFSEARTDLDAIKGVAAFNARLYEANDPGAV